MAQSRCGLTGGRTKRSNDELPRRLAKRSSSDRRAPNESKGLRQVCDNNKVRFQLSKVEASRKASPLRFYGSIAYALLDKLLPLSYAALG
jgi:hypothetical protein